MTPRLLTAGIALLLLPAFCLAQSPVPTTSSKPRSSNSSSLATAPSTATPSIAAAPAAPISTAPMSKETRMQIIRTLNAELVYVRTPFPMGEKGLHLRNGVLTPHGPEMQALISMFGPSAKPGDQARISALIIKDKSIIFEINGGPRKKTKWYQRISVSGSGGETPIAPTDQNANPRGSMVELHFDRHVPDLTPAQLKALLRPVFDFDAKSPVDAYLETVSPKVKEAIKDHKILVGMNREMVTYSKGRAEKKIREKDGEVEYEEWIYGEPPKDVEFVRLVGDEVVQMKIMKVDGVKIIHTEREVEITPPTAVAQEAPKPVGLPDRKPTLRRPGEDEDDHNATSGQGKQKRIGLPPPQTGGPPNYQTGS